MQSFLEKLSIDVVNAANLRQKEVIDKVVELKFCTCLDKIEYYYLASRLNFKVMEINTYNGGKNDIYHGLIWQLKEIKRQIHLYDLCFYCKIKEKVRNRNYINYKKGFLDV